MGGRALTVRGSHADGSGASGSRRPQGSALVLAIEHLWAVPLRDAGGIVLGNRSLTAEDLVAFGMDIGDEAALEAEVAATE